MRYKPSQEFGFYLKRRQEISKGTQAWECFSGTRNHKLPEPVPTDLWLDERVVLETSVLWEHSIGLPFYESVLSLLWIKDHIEPYRIMTSLNPKGPTLTGSIPYGGGASKSRQTP